MAPARNIDRPGRGAAICRQNKDLTVTGPPPSQDRAPDKTEPQNHALAFLLPRAAGHVGGRERRPEEDKIGAAGMTVRESTH